MSTTWAVIADAAKVHIYLYQGPNAPLQLIDHLEHQNKLTQDLVTTERGRMADKGPGQRSALEHSTDPHQHEKQLFAREISRYLDQRSHEADRIVLAAAPRFLGDLRKEFSEGLRRKIDGVLDKDLTNIPESDLPKHLSAVLNIG